MTPTKHDMLAPTEPGGPMRMMAALLADRGFDVRLPGKGAVGRDMHAPAWKRS